MSFDAAYHIIKWPLMGLCLAGSALFSGMTLGLMSMDCLQLEIIMRTGTEKERRFASAIYPVRKKGNLLLCTLLIGNMLVNNSLAILMADITSGLAGALISTVLTVVFGEVIPQAFCSRYGLAIGGRIMWLVKLSIALFFVASWPMAWILDKLLGAELIQAYSRQELSALVEIQAEKGNHEDDEERFLHREATLLKGAINFSSKIVEKIMTPISDVFMLEIDTKLGWQTCAEVFRAGHSRIPVYEKERNNVVGLLIVKDLILLDPDDEVPVRMVLAVYGRPIHRVFPDTRLDMVLNEFKTGKAHVALVHKVNDTDATRDPFYELIGLVTLEDVMEELIGEEIIDETDVYLDMQTKRKVSSRPGVDMGRIGIFQHKRRRDALTLSVPECKAIYAYLSEQVPEFSNSSMAEAFALRMLYEAALVAVYPHADGHAAAPPTDSSSAARRHGREVIVYEHHAAKGRSGPLQPAGAPAALEDTSRLAMGPVGPGRLAGAPLAVYRAGEPNQSFLVIVMQGELDVVAGRDGFRSRAGPWSILGARALKEEAYAPDFSCFVPGNETVRFLRVHRDEVRAAMHATRIFAADAVSSVTASDAVSESGDIASSLSAAIATAAQQMAPPGGAGVPVAAPATLPRIPLPGPPPGSPRGGRSPRGGPSFPPPAGPGSGPGRLLYPPTVQSPPAPVPLNRQPIPAAPPTPPAPPAPAPPLPSPPPPPPRRASLGES